MKNFSEILDTTYNITVNLRLEPEYIHEPPIVCVTWNTDLHHKITEYEDTQILMDAEYLFDKNFFSRTKNLIYFF